MSVELALHCWRSLQKLAGEQSLIHLTGGEPFGDYEKLVAILKQAKAEGLTGLEKIETNAYWCTDRKTVRQRFEQLRDLGVTKIQISTDIYHQQYVPIEHVRLGVEEGLAVFGEAKGTSGMQVRWRNFYETPIMVGPMEDKQRQSLFYEALQRRKERLLGRAADELAKLLPQYEPETFAGLNCIKEILGGKHVHVDGRANLFLGTCVGIIAGSVWPQGLDAFWCDFDWRNHAVLSVLGQSGPLGLLAHAAACGYQVRAGYAGKCHLCFELRRHLFCCGELAGFLGPGVCYGT